MPEGDSCTIILVRHGETDANRIKCFAASDDIELTGVGERQARELAQEIRERFHVSRVYSSPFTRARQTATIIARELKLPVDVLPGMRERNFGTLRGEPYGRMGESMRKDPEYDPQQRWLWIPENGESLADVQFRAIEVLAATGSRCAGEEIVVVSHGAVMESVMAHVTGDWSLASVPLNCGMLILKFDGGVFGLIPSSRC